MKKLCKLFLIGNQILFFFSCFGSNDDITLELISINRVLWESCAMDYPYRYTILYKFKYKIIESNSKGYKKNQIIEQAQCLDPLDKERFAFYNSKINKPFRVRGNLKRYTYIISYLIEEERNKNN